MIVTLAGFVAWCVGLVLIMVLVFRPIEFTRADAGSWEVTRAEGKRRFIVRFILGTLPFLGGVILALRSDIVADKAFVVVLLFLGLAILAAHQFWKYFEYQHQRAAKEAAKSQRSQ